MSRLLASIPLITALVAAPSAPPPARAGIAAAARRAAAAVVEVEIEEPAPAFAGDVMTDVRDVRACLPLEGGAVLAGTGGGVILVRADGSVRAPWTALDGLPETRVHALLREGERVWIGTEGGLAVARWLGEDLGIERSISGKPVRALVRHEGTLFAATWGGGVARLDERRGRLIPIRGAEPRLAATLAVHEGSLFAGGASGLYRIEDGSAVPVPGAPASIWTLASHAGRLWMGSLTGLLSLSSSGKVRTESTADVRALSADGSTLLAGTFGQGMIQVGEGSQRAVRGLDRASFVQAVGSAGVRCVGTTEGLFVQRGAEARWARVHVPEMPSNDVSAIAPDGDRLWIGTFDRGLALLDGGRMTSVRHPALDAKVNGLAVERRAEGSVVWVATARGLDRVEPGTGGVRVTRYAELDGLPSNDVHAVAALSSGGALVGTGRGAAIVREGGITVLGEKRGIPPGAVWAVAEGPKGTLLLGTSRGLLLGTEESHGVVDRGAPLPVEAADAGRQVQPWLLLSMASGDLLDDWVTAIASRGRTLYVGTYNAGVTAVTLDGNGFVVDQLGGGYVNFGGLLVQGRTLFAATMNGLLARPTSGDEGWRILAHAAPGRDVTALAAAGRKVWAASRRGLARSDPAL